MAFKMAPKAPCLQTTSKYSPITPLKQKSGASGDNLYKKKSAEYRANVKKQNPSDETVQAVKNYESNLYKNDFATKTNETRGMNAKQYATKKNTSFDAAFVKRDMKKYGELNKAQFKAEAQRQNRTKAKTGEYLLPKAKAINVKPRGPKAEDIVKSGKDIGKEKKDVKPTVAPKITSKVVTPKKEVKQTRAQRIRAKGEAALAGGDKKKALRLKRRLDRVEARAKRRSERKQK